MWPIIQWRMKAILCYVNYILNTKDFCHKSWNMYITSRTRRKLEYFFWKLLCRQQVKSRKSVPRYIYHHGYLEMLYCWNYHSKNNFILEKRICLRILLLVSCEYTDSINLVWLSNFWGTKVDCPILCTTLLVSVIHSNWTTLWCNK